MSRRALQILEILENILLQMDVVDLLRAQTVCKLWCELIQSSTSLQKALFFAPSYDGPFRVNSLLKAHFPAFFSKGDNATNAFLGTKWAGHFNRLLEEDPMLPRTTSTPTHKFDHKARRSLPVSIPDTVCGVRVDAYSRLDASWRRMLMCQPRPRELFLLLMHSQRVCFGRLHRVQAPEHTFGLVYDLLHGFSIPSDLHAYGIRCYIRADFAGELEQAVKENEAKDATDHRWMYNSRVEEARTRLEDAYDIKQKTGADLENSIIVTFVTWSNCSKGLPQSESQIYFEEDFMKADNSFYQVDENGRAVEGEYHETTEWNDTALLDMQLNPIQNRTFELEFLCELEGRSWKPED